MAEAPARALDRAPAHASSPAPRAARRRRAALTGGLAVCALAALSGAAVLGGLPIPRVGPLAGLLGQAPAPIAAPAETLEAAAAPDADAGAPTQDSASIPDTAPMQASAEPEAAGRDGLGSQVAATAEPSADVSTPFAGGEAVRPADPAPAAETPRLAQTVPLPVARPPEFRRQGGALPSRRADRPARRVRATAAAPAAEDDRSFFEKLFGIERSPPPALAYTALETKPIETRPIATRPIEVAPPRPIVPASLPAPSLFAPTGGGVAVYDISARVVTLPNGERLEAHSGLAEGFDDPRYVDLRMRGPTPPGTYDLTEREQLFHGVRALRLTPVGGSAAVYGRDGLLAHTYMLGASGASNGCVSFRDYDKFLQAYLRGEVQRLVVVTGRMPEAPAAVASRSVGGGSAAPGAGGEVRVASLP